jgi:hypothetical protein
MIPSGVIISDSGTITVSVNGKLFSFANDHMNYNLVKEALKKNDLDSIEKLADIPKSVTAYTGAAVVVKDGMVLYKDKPLDNSLTRRILNLMNEGFPFEPMLKFLENLMLNPSCHAVKELYGFLVHRNLPITVDGCFLAYKSVTPEYLDWNSRSIDNKVGAKIEPMERNEVDDNWREACSSGYHVGSIEYVDGFHRHDGHIMIVKVNPKDVVSVPVNECTKCRTCWYEVVGEMQEEELVRPVYATTDTSYTPSVPTTWSDGAAWPDSDDEENDEDDYEDWGGDEDDDDDDEDDDEFGPAEH